MNMIKKRTPKFFIFLRAWVYLAVIPCLFIWCVPPIAKRADIFWGIVYAINGTFFVIWNFLHFFSNTFTKFTDPIGYDCRKRAGGDPFYDDLSGLFNRDDEATRNLGLVYNAYCAHCNADVVLLPDEQCQCENCGISWYNGDWFWQ